MVGDASRGARDFDVPDEGVFLNPADGRLGDRCQLVMVVPAPRAGLGAIASRWPWQ